MRPTSNQDDDVHATERWRLRESHAEAATLVHKSSKPEALSLSSAPATGPSTIWRRRFPEAAWRSPKLRPHVSNQVPASHPRVYPQF
ncbi:hypothetical protein ACHHYP_01752 [Achlya hypogyna]|uniref:Uncharacterized protein n=1 Tax=Achlya hypogyna TaxID=1202772 RepID=A0A1V9ZT35_ACHHY|nr:hypothetical protein ACHHYP_01752 [Achlya hypogyna]